jgi:MEMO1 family protein
MKRQFIIFFLLYSSVLIAQNIRSQKDTIGFASKAWQMDSIIKRINASYKTYYKNLYSTQNLAKKNHFRLAICPHDDYTYAGFMYKEVFSHVKAKTIIIFGVAHKAKKYGIEQKLVFDNFEFWQAPYGKIKTSGLKKQIIQNLPQNDYIIHDSLQLEEHSVEAFLPFLQYYKKDVEIISILVPFMSFQEMNRISLDIAKALQGVIHNNNLKWGKDIEILISTDAVHYGDEDWNGKNYAPYGCDQTGYKSAVDHEYKILNDCFRVPDSLGAKRFFDYTVKSDDWHEYHWTWCGRYSVPFGILTAYRLQQLSGAKVLKKILTDYSTSISHPPLKVDDLNMGTTAPANIHHWVGYSVSGYK